MIGRALLESCFVSALVVVPFFPFGQIAWIELPVLGRIVNSRLQAFALSFFANVQEALDNSSVS